MLSSLENILIQVDSINIHKLHVVTPIKKQVELYSNISNQSPKSLPVIHLGKIKSKLFLLSDFDVFYGIKESKLTEVMCNVAIFDNDVDFIIEHVKLNKNPTGFNEYSLFDVVNYLSKNNITNDEIFGLLQLQPLLQKLLNLPLIDDVVIQLSQLNDYLSDKLTTFTIPYYIPEIISKIDVKYQLHAISQIIDLIKSSTLSDTKFSWIQIPEIQILLHGIEKSNSLVIQPDNHKSSVSQKKLADDLVKCSKNILVIPGNDSHPTYMINTKTHSVSTVYEKEGMRLVNETVSKKVFVIPEKIINFIGVNDSDDSVKTKRFADTQKQIDFLKNHPNIKCVIIYK